ncbi:MAG: DUF1071 domain-containing protein [Oscillospiraceae bacterium]
MSETKSVFDTLYEVDVSESIKEKNGYKYLPWSTAWAIVKKHFPGATYDIITDESNNGNIYHTDGKTCWVETTVAINGEVLNEMLPVLDFKNQPITLDKITSFNAGKSIKRCLVKNLALFGLGLSLWNGEELSDDAKISRAKKIDEIAAKQAQIVDMCKELATGTETRDRLYEIISMYNGGNKNPKSIKSVEVCDMIIAKINEEFGKEED